MRCFGIFKDLHDLNMPDCIDSDLYEGYFSRFYDKITVHTDYDIELYLQQASIVGSPVLELACGSGRITLKLASRGFSVTGVDLSPDMLDILRDKLEDQPNRIKKNVKLCQCDMRKIDLEETFNLVMLPYTSICLLNDENEIKSLFDSVYSHLAPGGRFIFDYRLFKKSEQFSPVQSIVWEDEEAQKHFVILQELVDFDSSEAIVNFYAEDVYGTTTRRYFGDTVKKIFSVDVIENAIHKSGFRLVNEEIVLVGGIEFKIVVLEK